MVKRLTALAMLVALAAAATVSAAPMKGWPSGKVCGRTCFAVRGATAGAFVWWWDDYSMPYKIVAAPRPARFYVVTLRYSSPVAASEQMLYVPSRHVARIYKSRTQYGPQPVGPYWRTVPGKVEPELRRIVGGVAPLRPPHAWPRVG
jgi:hypothetical protein